MSEEQDNSNIESSVAPENLPEEPTIGRQLREAREARGLSIDEVSSQTKIKKTFIAFLENNEFQKLHNLMTAKGLLKVYAGMLNLNVVELHKKFLELFPSEATHKPGREVKIGMAVDTRTLFPTGLKTMNSPGLSHSHASHSSKHNKKANKLLMRIFALVILIVTALVISTLYFRSSMSDIKNNNLRQRSDIDALEARDTPETSQSKIYDQNKVYIEAMALSDTFVTIITVADGRTLSQGFAMRRGDLKSWDGNQYIRIRSTTPRSLRLKVNGKDEGILNEAEKMFFTVAMTNEAATITTVTENTALEKNPPKADTTPKASDNTGAGTVSILNNI